MFYKINFTKAAQKQLTKLKKDKKMLARFLEIVDDIKQNPYSPRYKFERLRYDFSGFCSKRLDKKNRVLYKVEDGEVVVIIVSVLGHYRDN